MNEHTDAHVENDRQPPSPIEEAEAHTGARPTPREVIKHIVVSGRKNHYAVTKRCEAGELLRICQGVFLEVAYLLGLGHWEAIRAIEIARIYAVVHRRQTAVVCGLAAALVNGADTHGIVTTIDINCRSNARGKAVTLPKVRLPDGTVVPKGTVRFHCRRIPNTWIATEHGMRTTSALATIVWIALADRSEQSFAAACSLLGQLARFDTHAHAIDSSREREQRTIRRAVEGIAYLRNWGDKRAAVHFAEALSGACGPGGEARFLWLLFCRGLSEGVVLQLVVHTDGKHYRVDFAFPAHHLVIEFDGWSKYPGDGEALKRFLADQERRSRALDRSDWTVIRFNSDNLNDPDGVEEEIRGSMAAAERRYDLAV